MYNTSHTHTTHTFRYVDITATPKVTFSPASSLSLIGNLKPDIGDVDLGQTNTFMFPRISTSAMSDTYYVDVYLNTNNLYVETWKVYLYFNSTILKATGDFVNHISTGTLSASANVVGQEDRVTLSFSTTAQDLRGTYVKVASVGFTALTEGTAYLYPYIENMVQFDTGTYIAYQVRGFAGNGFVEVGDNRRRRRRRRRDLSTSHSWNPLSSSLPSAMIQHRRYLSTGCTESVYGDITGPDSEGVCEFNNLDTTLRMQINLDPLYDLSLLSESQISYLDINFDGALDLKDVTYMALVDVSLFKFLRDAQAYFQDIDDSTASLTISALMLKADGM